MYSPRYERLGETNLSADTASSEEGGWTQDTSVKDKDNIEANIRWYLEEVLRSINSDNLSDKSAVQHQITSWLNTQGYAKLTRYTFKPQVKSTHQHALTTLTKNQSTVAERVAKASSAHFVSDADSTRKDLHHIEAALFRNQARSDYIKSALLLTASLLAIAAALTTLAIVTRNPQIIANTIAYYNVSQRMLMLTAYLVGALGVYGGYETYQTYQTAKANSFFAKERSDAFDPELEKDLLARDKKPAYETY